MSFNRCCEVSKLRHSKIVVDEITTTPSGLLNCQSHAPSDRNILFMKLQVKISRNLVALESEFPEKVN